MPTYRNRINLIHFAAQKKHIGVYPGALAVKTFSKELDSKGLSYSKGTIRIPYSDDLPLELVGKIAKWCKENE